MELPNFLALAIKMKLTDFILEHNGDLRKCPICEKWLNRLGLPSHFHRTHNPNAKLPSAAKPIWNKGLTKIDPRVARTASAVSNALLGKTKKPLSEVHRRKISTSMEKAHRENRAHNIGSSRWNNEPSYPERFFSTVIENEFTDKNYTQEFPFGRFSLDFAWTEKKLCIEIDGEQHKRFKEYRERDERKDEALRDAGWKILRIEWKEMYKNPKEWILIAKNFVEEAPRWQPRDC